MTPWSGCVPDLKEIKWMHHFQGKVWWRGPPCFGDKESCFFGFGNNPLLPFIVYMLSISLLIACFDVL